jgi:cell division protein FtsI (penicillin-binding protein 3)
VYISNYHRRLEAVFALFLLILVLCSARLVYIQFFRFSYLSAIANKQHNLFAELEPQRGTIFDTNLKPQAINIAVDSLYATPNTIKEKDKQSIIDQLLPILNCDSKYLNERFARNKAFVWLARKVTPEQSAQIRKLKLKGIDFIKESKRCYPNAYLGAQVFGFAGMDNKGLEGLELYYDKYLKGEMGWALFLRDARQNKLGMGEKVVLPKDGNDLVLTIDEVIQYIAERELDKVYRTYHAKSASIVVMDPYSGAILALANRPTFDLNDYAKADREEIRNRAISDLFEPGSVFKIVTAAAALQEKKVVEEDKFFCENGSYKVVSHVLHDHTAHGWLTFKQVIEQSSNIGTTKVAQILGKEVIYRYMKLFGFGSKLGVDMPGEVAGIAKEPKAWSKISIAAIPIGHEVGVTALQLAAAISVIANGGQLVKPYIVREIKDKYGQKIKEFYPTLVSTVISGETAERLKVILSGVVEEGTGRMAKIDGVSVAGKTGTAQKIEPNGAYSHNKYIASFIGFIPADKPKLAIAVIVDEPHPYYYGGVVSAPVFKRVAGDALRYINTKGQGENIVLNAPKTAN